MSEVHQLQSVTATVAPDAAEVVAEIFREYGARGVAIVNPDEIRALLAAPDSLDYAGEDFLNTLGEQAKVTAWFDLDGDLVSTVEPTPFAVVGTYEEKARVYVTPKNLLDMLEHKINALDEFFPGTKGPLEPGLIREEDWAEAWKSHYGITRLGERIVICPSWLSYEAMPGEYVLKLDPGMAFGTGTHETTALMAEAIEQRLKQGDTMLDVGTGSGILALIGKKLGAGSIFAVDVDPDAVKTARENAAQNDVDVDFKVGGIEKAEGTFDIVVANIVYDVLVQIADKLYARTAKGGYLLTSGVLAERAVSFSSEMEKRGFLLEATAEKNDWMAFTFVRPL